MVNVFVQHMLYTKEGNYYVHENEENNKLCVGGGRTLPYLITFYKDKELKNTVLLDMNRHRHLTPFSENDTFRALNYLLLFNAPFRSISYFRLKNSNIKHKGMYLISNFLLKDSTKIEISGNIEGGLRIFHGYGTIIHCNKIGENLDVYQGVTIGRNPKTNLDDEICTPTIGNNVSIYANAVVIGNIQIGNNVSIGAGAVVYKSVPDNCTVVGNPMRIIQH